MRSTRLLTVLAFLFCSVARIFGGGSGLNVVVVVNQNSSNSIQLGNYYCEQRHVPPQNLLRINWPGGNTDWSRAECETYLAAPLRTMVSSRGLTNQVDYVLLSMDIPYRVSDSSGVNSTTSDLFYGFKADGVEDPPSCSLPANSTSGYFASEDVFRNVSPGTSRTNFLTMMLTSSNLAQAKAVADRGVASDGSFPAQTVHLAKSSDKDRNIRYPLFDSALFNTRLRGNYSMLRTNSNSPSQTNLLGFETGVQLFNIQPDTFVPGAMADSLTSYGGVLFLFNDHTTLLSFLGAGATASYGTVVEPCAYLEKFPSPQNYFYQSRGFSIAESYYMSLANPYQGLLVGEPLAAPFAQPSTGSWSNLSENAGLGGVTNLSLQFSAASADKPVQQVDLFLDGIYFQTLTNIAPRQGNILFVTLPGATNISYTVPASATLKSVTSELTSILNSFSNATKVIAVAHGDRIELNSADTNRDGSDTFILVSNSVGSASALTTFVQTSRSNFLDSIAWGTRSFQISGFMTNGDYLQLTATKTNGAQVVVGITNSSGTNVNQFVQQFLNAINAKASLQDDDGLAGEDLVTTAINPPDETVKFNLRARGKGFDAAQIQALVEGTFSISLTNTERLTGNLSDLQPRTHLFITAGNTNLAFAFPFDTTTQADGFHELTAVAYEGSSVRTQSRITRNVKIQNVLLSATFTTLVGGANTALETTLQFSVAANTITITNIELFSTGGSLASFTSQSSATFFVAGTNLGLGLHPFYAVVTRSDGKQYRTETEWIRLVGAEQPFQLSISNPPPTLFWTATAGRSYDILSATNITDVFQVRDVVVPSNSAPQWIETNPSDPQRLYRIRVSP